MVFHRLCAIFFIFAVENRSITMNEQLRHDILALCQQGEGTWVEFKSAQGGFPKSFWEIFSAFSNTDGGILVLGVKEKDGAFIPDGLTKEKIDEYKKHFWDCAHNRNCINRPVLVESDIKELALNEDAHLLIFNVPRVSYDLRPIYLTLSPFGHTYKRYQDGDYLCSDDEIKQMFSDANNIKSSADSRILHGYSMDDIDYPTLRQYRMRYSLLHENHPWLELDDQRFLEMIGAYRKDRNTSEEGFTVAGMLMFGKTLSITDPECTPYFFVDYRERLSYDPRIRWTNRVYPDGTWEANLYQFFSRVLPMMQHALPVPFRLANDGITRIETTTAHIALREAFANAIIHAAYTVMGNITVDRYFDHIVISNPGTMLVSVQEYHEGSHSVCRNPLLQKLFSFIGIGEKAGSGADIIAKGWEDNGWALPVIRQIVKPDRVEMTLTVPEITDEVSDNSEGVSDKVPDKSNKVSNKVPNKVSNKVSNKIQSKVLIIIEKKPYITIEELIEKTQLSKRSITTLLNQLKKQNKIRRVGARKNGHWEIVQPSE